MSIKQILRTTSGGLILSYKCSAECRHCMYACSQRWNADCISEEDIEKILTQLSSTHRVVYTKNASIKPYYEMIHAV